MDSTDMILEPASFRDLAHWHDDDHGAAFAAFLVSARRLVDLDRACDSRLRALTAVSRAIGVACEAALARSSTITTTDAARAFFEAWFQPCRVIHSGPPGLLTGYYEPKIPGARTRDARFRVPVLRRPPDLVNLVTEAERGARADAPTHARRTSAGHEPYPTRADIENGALDDMGLELVWLEDPVDAFFLHIQGSGLILLPDGTQARITYDGKNGHPYTSVGRYLIDSGAMSEAEMTLDSLKSWLKDDPRRGRIAMQINRSYVFFRELGPDEADAPLGVMEIPLTTGRSLAVDTAFHGIGMPIWIAAPSLQHGGWPGGFHRLMIAQDVGSAIRGPERGDIFFGSGPDAGRLAGTTKHAGKFFVLLPRNSS